MDWKGIQVMFVIVYAKCDYLLRRGLWHSLQSIIGTSMPLIIVGDFNIIKEDFEKVGGAPVSRVAKQDFVDFIDAAALYDLPYSGSKFTWHCNRNGSFIWERLDRALTNQEWMNVFPQSSVVHLERVHSDHAPLLVRPCEAPRSGPTSFRFQKMWLHHPLFLHVVQESWQRPCPYSGLQKMVHKLKRLKKDLRIWNKVVFGDIFQQINNVRDKIIMLENEQLSNSQVSAELTALRQHYASLLLQEEIYRRQHSRVKWLKEGDRNTAFFHAMARHKRQKSTITSIVLPSGNTSDSQDIKAAAVEHFYSLFQSENQPQEDFAPLTSLIPKLVTKEDNEMLMREITEEEVRTATCGISEDSAPGPDGFTSSIFIHGWSIICSDLMQGIREFFQGSPLSNALGASIIALIPKKENPSSFNEFRPISLCQVLYKIIAKVVANRLISILPRIVSLNQGGFVPGRLISENIALAQELIHHIHRRAKGANVVLKVDMAKAFDRVSWSYMAAVLSAFGFASNWVKLIVNIISSPKYSVKINGELVGFFTPSRGLRQGDPLSPLLFILSEEPLSRGLSRLMEEGHTKAYQVPDSCTPISHLLYADDFLVFTNGSRNSLLTLMAFLSTYERISGQRVNVNKSTYIVHRRMAASRKLIISTATGFQEGSLPFTYLGAPIHYAKPISSMFISLLDKMRRKLAGWKGKLLTMGGKLTLIRSVLSSMPIYLFAVIRPPDKVIKEIHKLFANFFWGEHEATNKHHWVSWEKCCLPCSEGGLGIRNLFDVINALHCKMAWRVLSTNSLWARFMRQKYLSQPLVIETYATPAGASHFWKAISSHFQFIFTNSCWLVREAKVLFWYDNWLGSGSLFSKGWVIQQPLIQLYDVLLHGGWNLSKLHELGGLDLVKELYDTSISIREGLDMRIWKPSTSGNFSTSSAWSLIRISHPSLPIHKLLWNSTLPSKISVFSWKLWKKVVTVDEVVQTCGIPLVSKCCCCLDGAFESLDHVFLAGPLARQVWRFFANVFGIQPPYHTSWYALLLYWATSFSGSSQVHLLAQLVPPLIVWELWLARNAARFNNENMSYSSICGKVSNWLIELSSLLKPTKPIPQLMRPSLQALGISPLAVSVRIPILVKWLRPPMGCFKMNIDGASLGNPGFIGCGGVLRDWSGNVIFGFTRFLGRGTNISAEVMALRLAVEMCYLQGFDRLWVETDSEVVSNWYNKGGLPPWYLRSTWEDMIHFASFMDLTVSHTYREANQVADSLASLGAHGSSAYLESIIDFPIRSIGCINSDRSGFPCIRFTKSL